MPGPLARLRAAFTRSSGPFEPLRFGPPHAVAGHVPGPVNEPNTVPVRVTGGPLSGTTLSFERHVQRHRADFALLLGDVRLGHYHFDRDGRRGLETMWEIIVAHEHQGKGLAALLVRLALRELLLTGRRHWVDMRRLMELDAGIRRPGDDTGPPTRAGIRTRTHITNIGIGIIAARLGFIPKPEYAAAFRSEMVTAVSLIEPEGNNPPAWLVHLKTLPGLASIVMLEPDIDGRLAPLRDLAAYRRFVNPAAEFRRALRGETLIGNIDYELSLSNLTRFCRCLCNTPAEYRAMRRRLRRP